MPALTSSSPPVGVPFGRYVIRTRLGRGGMGEVFLADQLGPLGPVRPVALKRLLPAQTDNPQVVRLFLEEMATAAQLSHPNIAVTYDFGEVEGVYFIAMEYVDGLPLDQLLRYSGPLPPDAMAGVALGITQALQYAHERRSSGTSASVIHQDVTPHNIIVSREGECKLLDFGIAKTEAAARQGTLRAKVRYAAPEQLRGALPDRRFDIWSLGVTMYLAVSGKLPFPQRAMADRLTACEAGDYVPLEQAAPHAAALAPVIHRALCADPEARFASADAMGEALMAALPMTVEHRRAQLRALVAEASSAPAEMDGGELTATGIAAPTGLTPRPESSVATQSVHVTNTAPIVFEDDGPTRLTAKNTAVMAAEPEPEPVRKSHAWTVVLLGLTLGAVIVGALRWSSEAPVVQSALPSIQVGAAPPGEAAKDVEAAKDLEIVQVQAVAPKANLLPTPAIKKAPSRRKLGRSTPSRTVPKSKRRPAPKAEPKLKPIVKAKPAAPASGLLSVRTMPWGRVFVDGQALGQGVIARRPLPAGQHELRLVPGEGQQPHHTVTIRIRGGETTRVFYNFDTAERRITPP